MSKRVMISGGFDPLHIGHVRLVRAARRLGAVAAIVDSDAYVATKHRVLMPQEQRATIIGALRGVDVVFANERDDGDCSELLLKARPDIFLVGPDHAAIDQLPEYAACAANGIEVRCATELVKDTASSDFVKKLNNPPACVSAIVTHVGKPGKVLLGVRNTFDGRGRSDLLGGFVEPGETLEAAAQREAREEASINVLVHRYLGSRAGTYTDGRPVLVACFVCVTSDEPAPTGEMQGFSWVDTTPGDMHHPCDKAFLDDYFVATHARGL